MHLPFVRPAGSRVLKVIGSDSVYQRQEPGSCGRPDRGAVKDRSCEELALDHLMLLSNLSRPAWRSVVCLMLLGDGSASAAVGACIRTLLYANLRPASQSHATRWAPSQCACAAMDSKALNYAQVKSRMSLVLPHEAKKVWSVLQRCAAPPGWTLLTSRSGRTWRQVQGKVLTLVVI